MSLAVMTVEPKTRSRDETRHDRDMLTAKYRLYHRLSHADIGRIMACSTETVRLRLRRAEASGDPRIEEWQALWDDRLTA